MMKAGWLIMKTTKDQIVAVCLYCNCLCDPSDLTEDPKEVHRTLSPNCDFILHISPDPFMPLPLQVGQFSCRERIRSESRGMKRAQERKLSFENWPHPLSNPFLDRLVREGFFFTGNATNVRCFSCHSEKPIHNEVEDLAAIHVTSCTYHQQLTGKSWIALGNRG